MTGRSDPESKVPGPCDNSDQDSEAPAAAEPRRDNDHSVAASEGQCTIRTGTEKWNQPEARIRPGQPQPENDSDVTHGFCSVHVDSECYQNASDLCRASLPHGNCRLLQRAIGLARYVSQPKHRQ